MGIVEVAKGVKHAIVMAKKPNNFRHLATKETEIARQVFEGSIPYSKVTICDGLGFEGRPFTMPNAGPGYVLFVGDGHYGMSSLPADKALLIHELVHVWQGEHSRWRWTFMAESGWSQLCHGDAAYHYDPTKLKDWDSYNPEQQAQIVEGWYVDGMSRTDPRYPYIRRNIRGDHSIDLPPEPLADPVPTYVGGVRRTAHDPLRRAVRLRQRAPEAGGPDLPGQSRRHAQHARQGKNRGHRGPHGFGRLLRLQHEVVA